MRPAPLHDRPDQCQRPCRWSRIDSNGFDITISQALLAPEGSGVSAIAVTSGGAGYVDTPVVVLSGGSGTGAPRWPRW
ncbi:hypothetical protein [Verrucomicrobium spinosum]|uniref:hypothetical protein n=1 Tax=Verrucomicrobium spinosum TaxID=2736 RepID=UPI000946334D|nr:hypothetical protein [Verrucomicrobium spinosum]